LVSSYIDRVENQKGHVKICVVTGPPKSNEDFSKVATGSTIGYEFDKMPTRD
jgi:hypothetical protein